jgi:hypothetical protein
MEAKWDVEARALAVRIETELGTEVVTSPLSEKLLMLELVPPNRDAAEIRIVVSSTEAILTAGKGTRFELGPLPASEEELMLLVRSISAGGLNERIGSGVVHFELRLEKKEVRTGRSASTSGARDEASRRIAYAPYQRQH